MKGEVLKAGAILVLFFTLTASTQLANGNFYPTVDLTINSPIIDHSYNSHCLVLNVTVSYFFEIGRWIAYSVDGLPNVTILDESFHLEDKNLTITAALPDLSDGLHHLDVYAKPFPGSTDERSVGNIITYKQVTLTVDTTPIKLSNISIENQAYAVSDVPLVFFTNENASYIGYSLDNQENVTILGNTTLRGLPAGSHNIVVYARDIAGNVGSSERIYFAVNLPPEVPNFSMPKEYLNYTITERNAIPWATIDGIYPIYCPNANNVDNITMVYPTPPDTTNITIALNGTQLNWRNFTEIYPDMLHHTVLGDWAMVEAEFKPSDFFTLTIHYEHPIIESNGTFQFLYDLNISPYLSSYSPNSTAYFNLKSENELRNLQVFTVPSDNQSNPINYTYQKQTSSHEVTFEVTSEYSQPLPGDVLVTFAADKPIESTTPAAHDIQAENFTPAIIIIGIAAIAVVLVALVYRKRRGSKRE